MDSRKGLKILTRSTLTFSQIDVLKSFRSWLKEDSNIYPFVLSGYAGSGKTFLSTKFLELAEGKGMCWTSVAPTHKAVGVLHLALINEGLKPTWHPSTIHRLLRLKLKRKGDLEICEETEQTKSSLEHLGLVLIDEASMIDRGLLEIILQCAKTHGTRLVFVGDPAQLPPIGEEESSVFSMKCSMKRDLKEVVRHQGPVLELAGCIREGKIPSTQPSAFPEINAKGAVVECLRGTEWLESAKNALKLAALEENPDGARILCYTNRSLEQLVPHARRAIHGEMADQLPVLPGEVLISREAVMVQASRANFQDSKDNDMLLGSNRELVVLDVKPEIFDLKSFGILNNSNIEAPVIDTLIAKVKAGELELSLRLVPPVESLSRKKLESTLLDIKNKAKSLERSEAKGFWKKFFLLRDSFASLGPASVLTVHRSQGSTFDQVYISQDVFWPKNDLLRKQLIYVAVSRARHRVCILGSKRVGDTSIWRDQISGYNSLP